jgi:hypothetical protein
MFERLLQLGHPSQLMLDTQYRMRSEISSWPSRTFYGGMLQDGGNVMHPTYGAEVQQLLGLGPYAFIDVTEVGPHCLMAMYPTKCASDVRWHCSNVRARAADVDPGAASQP